MRLVVLLTILLAPLTGRAEERPKPGQPAPAFELMGSSGGPIKLANFLGKRAVVLAFFPKAFTGG
jgi:peroxiredoxin Q/BCP